MIDLVRLKSILLMTGLQKTNNPLYQTISQLIQEITNLSSDISKISGVSSSDLTTSLISSIIMMDNNDENESWPMISSVTGIQGIQGPIGPPGLDGNNFDESDMIPFRIISASELMTGTLADARLSSNVPLLNVSNIFTIGPNHFVAAASAFAVDIRGRSSDNVGILGFYSNNGATRYGYLQADSANSGTLTFSGDAGGQFILGLTNASNVSLVPQVDNIVDLGTAALEWRAAIVHTLSLKNTGGAATSGQLTLVTGTKTVNTTAMTATALLFVQRKTAGGTIGFATTYTQVNGTSFTLNSDSALDTSVYNWWIVETH